MVTSTKRIGQSGPLHPSSRRGLASLLALALSTGMVSTSVLIPTVAFAQEALSPISAPQNVVTSLSDPGLSDTNKISTSWSAPATTGDELISYRAELLQNGTPLETIDGAAQGQTYATFAATLVDGSSYSTRITAYSFSFPAGTTSPNSNVIVAPTAGDGAPSVPLNVKQTVDEVTRRVTLTWDTPASRGDSPLSYYSVELLADGSPVQYSQESAFLNNSHTFYRPLVEGKTYTASVSVYNANSRRSPVATSSPGYLAPAASTPSAPQNVSSTVKTVNGGRYLSALWSAPATTGDSAIAGYQAILLEDGVGVTGASGSITPPTEFSRYPLKNGRSYTVSVSAYNSNQVAGPAAVSVPFITAKAAPTAPLNVTASQTGGDSTTGTVRVSWAAPADNGGGLPTYTVRLTDGADLTYEEVTNDLASSLTGLPLATYTYSVQAVTTTGSSPVASGAAPITVAETLVAPSFTTQPDNYQTPTEGDSVTLTTVVAGTPTPTVQWQVSTTTQEDSFTDVAGATSPTYTFTASVDSAIAYYRAVATNSSAVVLSDIAAVQVSAAPLSAPRNLTSTPGTDTDTGKLRFNWDAPLKNGGVPILRYDVAIDGTHLATAGLATSYLLDPETLTFARGYGEHKLTVSAINENSQETTTVLAYSLTRVGPPTLPRVDAAPVIGRGRIEVSWLAPENDGESAVTGYDLVLRPLLGSSTELTYAVTDPTLRSHTFTGMAPNDYVFAVRATNAKGTTNYADLNSGVVYREAPSAPQNVTYTQVSNTQVDVTFTAPEFVGSSAITNYGTVGPGVTPVWGSVFPGTRRISGLTVGQTYNLGVLARNTDPVVGLQVGAVSSQSFTMVQKFAPSAPRNLRAAPDADGNLVVNYDAPVSDGGVPVTQYKLAINGTQKGTISSEPGAGTFTIPAVPSGELALTVTATNAVGVSEAAALSYVYARTGPPTRVQNLVQTQDGQGGLTITWAAPLDVGGAPITGYEVTLTDRSYDEGLVSRRSLTGLFDTANFLFVAQQPGVRVFNVAGGVTTLTIPGLTKDTRYSLAVVAKNNNGTSPVASTSSYIRFSPSVLRNFTATQTGEGQVTVTWAAPSFDGGAPITGYEIDGDDYDYSQEAAPGVFRAVFIGVTPGLHTFRGYAYTGDYYGPEVTTQLTVVAPYVAPVVLPTPAPPVVPTPAPPVDLPTPAPPVVPTPAPPVVLPTPAPPVVPTPAPPVVLPTPAPETGFVPATPARLLDTRTGATPSRTGPITLTLRNLPAGTRSVLLNVTAAGASTVGHVTAYAAGTAKPSTSNLNFAPGQTQANLVAVPVGADGRVVLDVTGTTGLVADLVGTYGAGDGFAAVRGDRRLDTRNRTNGARTGSVTVTLGDSVPADATYVLLNVTATDADGPGHVTTGSGGSSLNYTRGITQANLVPVKIGPGRTATLTTVGSPAHLLADVQGYWTGGLVGEPSRLLDTRSSGGPVRSVTVTLPAVPAGATSVLLNLTVTGATSKGYATAYPSGTTRPKTSSLNWEAGQTKANLLVLPVLPNGKVVVHITGDSAVNVIADLVGFQR